MKIVMCSSYFEPSIGGVETSVQLLAEGLIEEKAEPSNSLSVTVITWTPAGSVMDAKFPYPVIRQPSLCELWSQLAAADVVHLEGPVFKALVCARLLRKPVVIRHYAYQTVCPNGLLFYQPTRTVCPGHFQARRYDECWTCQRKTTGPLSSLIGIAGTFLRRALSWGVAANVGITAHTAMRNQLPHSSHVYYGIPEATQRIDPLSIRPTIAFVGRLVSEKGIPVLLKALKILKSQKIVLRLKLIGEGPEKPMLLSLISDYQLHAHIEWTGFLQGDALETALQDVMAVVMPSIWEETAGLSAIEQMMRGGVVVVSDIGGLGEVVGDAGLKVPLGDAEALASGLRTLLENPTLQTTYRQSAARCAQEKFNRKAMTNRFLELYQNILKR